MCIRGTFEHFAITLHTTRGTPVEPITYNHVGAQLGLGQMMQLLKNKSTN